MVTGGDVCVWRSTARLGTVLACVLVPAVLVGDPAVAAQGVSVEIVELPDRFIAGARPETVTVVASKQGGDCQKVRWSMLLRLEGLSIEQLRVDRIEEDGSFPVDVDTDGESARVTDERLDPGTLCRNRTVTARYRLNVANDVQSGKMTVFAEAYDADLRLLERAGATRTIVGAAGPADPTASAEPPTQPGASGPTAAPTGQPGATIDDPPADEAADQAATAGADDGGGLPLAWFLIGGLLMFLGLSLLLNVRSRQRLREPEPEPVPVQPLSGRRTLRQPAAASYRQRR
jgi:hypothetical protein